MAKDSFPGFPARAEVTPIPNVFITGIMPRVENIAELKTVLHVFWLLSRRRGYPQFITYGELLSDAILMGGIDKGNASRSEILRGALDLAVQHGTMLHLRLDRNGETEDVYLVNSETGKKTMDQIRRGELTLPGLRPAKEGIAEAAPPPDIYRLYEQNIGMLTPIIAQELQEAEKLYPPDWIESAFREAVAQNKRSWKYIVRILERWAVEGKDNGKLGRDTKKEDDRDKYIKGRYGHMVQR
ncbi:MAG: DnaD domain protein [Dehalococcoidia bacterium]|nr:DnaD domain protein [Dehalococcoidia bacterium]